MLTVVLTIVLSLVAGVSIALLQGYLRMRNEIRERDSLRQEISNAVRKILESESKSENRSHPRITVSTYKRDIDSAGEIYPLNLKYPMEMRHGGAALYEYDRYQPKASSPSKYSKTNGIAA